MMLSFGHLLPEAVTTMAQIVPNGANKALVFCLVGYMAMLFIEKVAFSVHEVKEELPASFDSTGKIANVLTAPQSALVAHNIESSNRQKSAIALCCAISVHSFFEAAALGLATDFTSACMMSACIALHQPAESVALLVAFLKSDLTPRQIACWLTAYSLMSVVGVLAGLMMTTWANRQMEAMVMAITAGTFIYVGATEVSSRFLICHTLPLDCYRLVSFLFQHIVHCNEYSFILKLCRLRMRSSKRLSAVKCVCFGTCAMRAACW